MVKDVGRKYRDCLWESSEERKKIALVSWDKVCVPKHRKLQDMEHSFSGETVVAIGWKERCPLGEMGQ